MRGHAKPNQDGGAGDIRALKVRAQRLRELWEQAPDLTEPELLATYREKYDDSLSLEQLQKVIRTAQKEVSGARTAALKAHVSSVRMLLVEHPRMTSVQLTAEHNRRYQSNLSAGQMARIVQAVDRVRWKRLVEDERVSRPRRLAEILAAHPEMLYSELCTAYENRYGIKLVQPQVSQALIKIGVRRQDPKRGKEAEEFSHRPNRLKALHKQHPHWTNDELAAEYKRRYGIKLAIRQISYALLSAGVRRRRGRDVDEMPQRPERLKALHQQHTKWTDEQLAVAYERRYHVTLKHPQVSAALLKAGIRRQRVVDADELAERPKRLKALQRRHTAWTYDQIAVEYEHFYGIKLENSEVSAALQRLGIRRNRAADAQEFSKRPGRVKALFKRHHEWTGDQLASEYARRYHIKLDPGQISQALLLAGVRRQKPHRPRNPEEFSMRPERLKELLKKYPHVSYTQLAEKYKQLFHVGLTPNNISAALSKVHIRRRQLRPLDSKELLKRPERLRKLAQKYPQMNRTQLAEKYEHTYDTRIAPSAVSVALKKSGYQR